jgi:hypothetical protein
LDHLKAKSLLPATVFLLNREAVENEAKHLMSFQEDHMELARIKTLWNKHLLKYRSIYEHTPQWAYVYDLICKGIGIHHSGMIPILREMPPIPEDLESVPTLLWLSESEVIHDGPLPPVQKNMSLKLRESTR